MNGENKQPASLEGVKFNYYGINGAEVFRLGETIIVLQLSPEVE